MHCKTVLHSSPLVICISFYNWCRETRERLLEKNSHFHKSSAYCDGNFARIDSHYLLSHNILHTATAVKPRKNEICVVVVDSFSVFIRIEGEDLGQHCIFLTSFDRSFIYKIEKIYILSPITLQLNLQSFTINEEFISFLNGSLCVVADKTHT